MNTTIRHRTQALRHLAVAGALGAAALLPLPAFAQAHEHHVVAAATPAKSAEPSEGEVRKVDPGAKTITLKHGPLKNLDMPAMTMAFRVADPAMLAKVKVGEKVRFVAENPGGKLTIMQIELAK